jgi:hypothetical protein
MKRITILIPLFLSAMLVGCFPVATETPASLTPIPSSTFTETAQPNLDESDLPSPIPSSTFTETTQPVPDEPDSPSPIPSPSLTETIQPVPALTITSTFCPPPTPEPLWVDPVTSPTDQLTQVITVYIGNGEEVTIETESGTFTVTGQFNHHTTPAKVEITLLPNTVHHLEVTARVRAGLTGPGNCTYGGYTLMTRNDRNGVPLVIVQGAATP